MLKCPQISNITNAVPNMPNRILAVLGIENKKIIIKSFIFSTKFRTFPVSNLLNKVFNQIV